MIRWLLTRTITTTDDRQRAERSCWEWGEIDGVLTLRVIGVMNGLLRPFGVGVFMWMSEGGE